MHRLKTIFLLFVLIIPLITKSQVLARFFMYDNTKIGYGVEMFYYISDMDSLLKRINMINSINEKSLLENIGLPIIRHEYIDHPCLCCNGYSFKAENFFKKKNKKRSIAIYIGDKKLLFDFVRADNIDICKVQLLSRVWASYDALFNVAVFINGPLSRVHLSSYDKICIGKLKTIITNK